MMELAIRETAFGRVLCALMQTRGLPANEKEARILAEETGLDPERLLVRMSGETVENIGPLDALADRLILSQDEMEVLAKAYAFEKGSYIDVARVVYGEIVTHLDLVASMDEEEHGGSATSRRIREVLIPHCEREGGLKTNAERVAEHLAGRDS